MKIFFIAGFKAKKTHQHIFNKIVEVLKDLGHEVGGREVEQYEDRLDETYFKALKDDSKHYAYIKKGVEWCDAVVMEATVPSFQMGHEATLVLLYNKPVLCLFEDKDYSSRIIHPKFYTDTYYKESNIKECLVKFFDEVKDKHLSVRFNGFISPQQKSFLDKYAKKRNITLSDAVRELINEKMDLGKDGMSSFGNI